MNIGLSGLFMGFHGPAPGGKQLAAKEMRHSENPRDILVDRTSRAQRSSAGLDTRNPAFMSFFASIVHISADRSEVGNPE
jgi:uncharacterized MAPEG superfamily protein